MKLSNVGPDSDLRGSSAASRNGQEGHTGMSRPAAAATGAAIAAKRPELMEQLSPTQQLVLEMLLSGMSQPQIAQTTGRSLHTIHDHTKAIYQRLKVRNRVELLLQFTHPTV
ncbi:MAG TPA: helix-turn-helix transcriptional regulator [Phycisphaerales bacterium]|nr:helix-turn-helix transcriptional regulator [Phycisphaerales bacterium]